jgi:hypothetical protein
VRAIDAAARKRDPCFGLAPNFFSGILRVPYSSRWIYIASTWTTIRLTRRNCVPTGYGPNSAVSALEDLIGRSRVRTPITLDFMLPQVKRRRDMNCVLCVGHSVDVCNGRRSVGECWIYIART